MQHAKTDSDATSLTASSPPRSPPRRPVYYVQSPSHDDEKHLTTMSYHSTPAFLSPTASPPPSHSYAGGHHSRESSSTRFSGSFKPNGSGRIPSNDIAMKSFPKPWDKQFNSIEEEALLDDDDSTKSIPRRCYVLGFIVCFLILFAVFALILYGVSKPQKPELTMRSIKFERFVIQAGSDSTGVATDMVSVNSTVKFTFRNTASFFGLHVTSTPLDLSFSQIALGSGTMKKFYQKRKSQRLLTVLVIGDKVPLYGSGLGLKSSKGIPTAPVPMKLSFVVRSRGYVLGKLVKPKFFDRVECSVAFDPDKINVALSLKNNCKFLTVDSSLRTGTRKRSTMEPEMEIEYLIEELERESSGDRRSTMELEEMERDDGGGDRRQ
ncbi:hypothetical protein SSX86_001883 [Deinandra increscens subsp. villosa]|uniref:Late embryogenesis abundant protein LEA-2 subgroup domain-containing protein n=1 Tax=Deinandra increscens subsp. villosa TaxID=3103831 RepID=A0AAP0DVT3_9ASTR